jgi:hypothetical protein
MLNKGKFDCRSDEQIERRINLETETNQEALDINLAFILVFLKQETRNKKSA